MSRILLFISTGRCGTQYITRLLSQSAGERALVSHEPLQAQYKLREYFRAADLAKSIRAEPEIQEHFKSWDIALDSGRSIIETGWPIFPWLPYLAERYQGRLDIVHVVRNPVRFAFSLASHEFYSNRRQDEYTELAALYPSDPGIKHKEYEKLWPELNLVERCLFQWLEINEFAEELAEQGMVAMRFRSEDIFPAPNKLLAGIRQLNAEWAEVLQDTDVPTRIVDEFNFTLSEPISSVRVPQAVDALAQKFGYGTGLDDLGVALMDRFYCPANRQTPQKSGLARWLPKLFRGRC